MANWVGLKTFRTETWVWINLDQATLIRQGAAAFAEAVQITIPGQPDVYVAENLEEVVRAAGKN